MARAKSSDGSVYVVARYRPAGNVLNSFNDNVVPKVRLAETYPPVIRNCGKTCGNANSLTKTFELQQEKMI